MNLNTAHPTAHPRQTEPQLNVQILTAPALSSEIWTRDDADADLWHGPHGVIVNTAALEERKRFYRLIQLR